MRIEDIKAIRTNWKPQTNDESAALSGNAMDYLHLNANAHRDV